jgi:lipid II:glycine glycyltransferase (peptidoglycan interpeptide bridge formation enzyme)
LVSKYFKTDFYYLGLQDKRDELIGICPIHETGNGLIKNLNSGQFHYIPNGGWLLNREKEIKISGLPIPFNARIECFTLPSLKEFKVSYSKPTKSFCTLIVDLEKKEDEIWSEYIDPKRRNMIRKALKTGLQLKNGFDALKDFYILYSENSSRNGPEKLPLNFFEVLIRDVKNIHFKPFVAYKDDSPCGSLGLIYDKNYALYWLGATKHNAGNFGQGELLQWEAIKDVKVYGCKYYDLCYIEKERLPHIYEFKKGFSKTEVEVPYIVKKQIMFRIINKLWK